MPVFRSRPTNLFCAENLLHPAYNSSSGRLLESWNKPELPFSEKSLSQKVATIALRILQTFAYLGATLVDFIILLAMTITVIPAIQVGGKTHLKNLICNIASLALGFGILFGHKQQVDKTRKLFGKPFVEIQVPYNFAEIEEKTKAMIAAKKELNFNHLLPFFNFCTISDATLEEFEKICNLMERLVKAGADINGVVKKTKDDNTHYCLIHHIATRMSSHRGYKTKMEGMSLLLRKAIELGADPHQKAKKGSYFLWHHDIIDNCIVGSQYDYECISAIEMMLKKGIRLDRKIERSHVGCSKRYDDHSIVAEHPLVYAAYVAPVHMVALLLEGGASIDFSRNEEANLNKLYERSTSQPQYTTNVYENIQLIKAMKRDASVIERRSAATMFLLYDCMNQFNKFMSQPDIIPTDENERIEFSSDLLSYAILSGKIELVKMILGKVTLTWNEEVRGDIAKYLAVGDPFSIQVILALEQYKATVRETIQRLPEFTELKEPANMIVDYLF